MPPPRGAVASEEAVTEWEFGESVQLRECDHHHANGGDSPALPPLQPAPCSFTDITGKLSPPPAPTAAAPVTDNNIPTVRDSGVGISTKSIAMATPLSTQQHHSAAAVPAEIELLDNVVACPILISKSPSSVHHQGASATGALKEWTLREAQQGPGTDGSGGGGGGPRLFDADADGDLYDNDNEDSTLEALCHPEGGSRRSSAKTRRALQSRRAGKLHRCIDSFDRACPAHIVGLSMCMAWIAIHAITLIFMWLDSVRYSVLSHRVDLITIKVATEAVAAAVGK